MTDPLADAIEPGSASWWADHQARLDRRRPRAGGLTVERVVDEALALVDDAGLDALTVRRLAARLGTSSATLYRHVASVDELLVLLIDRVLGEIALPEAAPVGPAKVMELAVEFRRVLVAHPGVVPALRAAPLLGPNATRSAAFGLVALLEAGFRPEVAVPAYLATIDYILGSVFFDTAGAADRDAHRRRDRVQADRVFDVHADVLGAVSSDAVFRFGVEAMLRGIPD